MTCLGDDYKTMNGNCKAMLDVTNKMAQNLLTQDLLKCNDRNSIFFNTNKRLCTKFSSLCSKLFDGTVVCRRDNYEQVVDDEIQHQVKMCHQYSEEYYFNNKAKCDNLLALCPMVGGKAVCRIENYVYFLIKYNKI